LLSRAGTWDDETIGAPNLSGMRRM
jgi:hypothetical protein